ncbi:MAG TPA: NAD(P)-binding protein, partial [Candidatus Eisenbacteria bacterium]
MLRLIARYTEWLHTRWPAGTVEKLPEARQDGSTNLRGATISGDLTGIPLLKFALDSGARAVSAAGADADRASDAGTPDAATLDLAIIGAGVSGMAAAVEARRQGLRFEILEATEPFSTLVNFPKAKP